MFEDCLLKDKTASNISHPQHVELEKLEANFRSLGRFIFVTKGHFEVPTACSVEDVNWNFMDQLHRKHVHHAYLDAIHIAHDSNSILTLNADPILNFPMLMMVSNIRVASNRYYQSFSLFNLFFVLSVIQHLPRPTLEGEMALVTSDWFIVSHKLLKFLHPVIGWMLRRMNVARNREDEPVRVQRSQLRQKKYSFATDTPDFLNSNSLDLHVIPPSSNGIYRIALKSLTPFVINKASVGSIELLLKPESA